MKIFDYAPHIHFKNDFYRNFQRQFLNMHDATEWLANNVLTDQVIRIYKQAGFEPSNNKLKAIPLELMIRNFKTTLYIVCEITDMSMYKKYAAGQLGDVLYKKCFLNGWPYMRPILIYGPEKLYSTTELRVESWAKQHNVLCMGNNQETLKYIANFNKQ